CASAFTAGSSASFSWRCFAFWIGRDRDESVVAKAEHGLKATPILTPSIRDEACQPGGLKEMSRGQRPRSHARKRFRPEGAVEHAFLEWRLRCIVFPRPSGAHPFSDRGCYPRVISSMKRACFGFDGL